MKLFKTILTLLLVSLFVKSLLGVAAYEISNNGAVDLRNVVVEINLPEAKLVKIIDKNNNLLDFCYYHEDTNLCDNVTSNKIFIRIPFLPGNSKYHLIVIDSSQNYAKDGASVFEKYYDFKNYIPEEMNYSSVDAEGGYCFYGDVNRYVRISNLTLTSDYYVIKFNMRGYSSPTTYAYSFIVTPTNYRYYLFYLYASYPAYTVGTIKLAYNSQTFDYNGRSYTRTYIFSQTTPYSFEFKIYYVPWYGSYGFCLKSLLMYKNYSSVSVREIPPANFVYTFTPECYYASGGIIQKKANCSNLPIITNPTDSIFVYSTNDDMWMEIKSFSYNYTAFPTIKITMNKLDEGIGYVRFVAAIENASFQRAYVKVPVLSDVNKQLINVTKNGQPYYVTKYYLTFEFNETDPIFEAFLPIKAEKEEEKSLVSKLIDTLMSLFS